MAGVDISKFAVQKAARRCPELDLAVASADRLPVVDGAVDRVLNVFSPLAIEEFRRVLKAGPPDEVLSSPEFYQTFHLRMGKGGV